MAKSAPNFTPTRRPSSTPVAREPLAYLRADDKLASLLPAAQQLAQLQAECERQLPMLFGHAQVLQLRERTLNIGVPNAALATRLRQVLPKLQQGLRAHGWEVEQIRLKVQPMSAQTTPTPPRERRELSNSALASFASLASEVEDSPLRDALNTLLQRHGRGQP